MTLAPSALAPAPPAWVPPAARPAAPLSRAEPPAAAAPAFPLTGFLGGLGAAAVLLALWMAWTASKTSAQSAAPTAEASTLALPPGAQATLRTFSPPSGALIGGVYKAVREIGSGGMGVVYEALDTKLDRRVAIKRLRPEIGQSPRGRERFLAEARTVAKLQHPNIVNIHAIIEEGPDLFLVFEFVDGLTLDQMLGKTQRLAPAELVRVFVGVAEAVDHAHSQRVIHRDLKPSNIMVDATGRPRVMDFGIAHQARVTISQLTMAEAAGTYPYMPPEQALGHAVRESDVFAFAAVAYEALTGDLPFPGPDFNLQKAAMAFKRPSEAIPVIPRAADAVFERAFQSEPKRRYPTTGEFVRTLAGAISPA